MEAMPWDTLGKLSPWALLSLAVLAMIRGWLMPRSTVQMLMQRAEDYKAAWETEREARALQGQQLAQLVEYAKTADAVLRSLPQVAPAREPAA